MNEYEDDWLRLGKTLRNYQPEGQPEVDFAGFQALRQEATDRPHRRWLFWLCSGLILLISAASLVLLPMEKETQEIAQGAEQTIPVGLPIEVTIPEVAKLTTVKESESYLPELLPDTPVRTPSADSEVFHETPLAVRGGEDGTLFLYTAVKEADPIPPTSGVKPLSNTAINRLEWPLVSLEATSIPQEPVVRREEATAFRRVSRKPYVTMNTGLSSHWRGSTFLEDTDQGIYVSLGLRKPIGRFILDGRMGYRGHNMNLQVLEGPAEPWSHYEDKARLFNDEGQEVEYTYTGIVDGYKGIEFSLLLSYQLSERASFQAGGRYSLPSLGFRRTVISSHDGDVTQQPNPYHFFTTETPLVKYHDYGVLAGAQYRISKSFAIEGMLHLGMVDLIEDAGEQMQRFNHSSSLSIGLSYRLE